MSGFRIQGSRAWRLKCSAEGLGGAEVKGLQGYVESVWRMHGAALNPTGRRKNS